MRTHPVQDIIQAHAFAHGNSQCGCLFRGEIAGENSEHGAGRDAQINTDRNLKLQYLAGLGLNLYQSDAIYKAMIREAKYPEDLFEGSAETLAALKARIDASLSGVSSF